MDVEFNNILELYERLKPALLAKVAELKRNDINYINPNDSNYSKRKQKIIPLPRLGMKILFLK